MNLQEIKQAISKGLKVHWSNSSYSVINAKSGYLIKHVCGNCIGLTHADNVTLNGNEDDFYINYIDYSFPVKLKCISLGVNLSNIECKDATDLKETLEILTENEFISISQSIKN